MNQVCSKRTALCLFIGLLIATAALAQSDLGSISGFVRDPSGATIPNAKVTIRSTSGSVDRTTTTNESGLYTVTNIPPTTYTIVVEAPGFKRFESADNKLDPSSKLALDATLTVGAATESIEVTATASALQTESASVQKNVTREQIDSLELNGRNPVGLASLVPGARGGNLAGLSFNFSQGPANFNGSRNPENLITYDGAPATRTRSNGTSLGAADVDSTQEVQILTAAYAAEYGRTSGAQIRILTRSGSSQFHGSAYEYLRNTVFNANTWTRNHTPDVPGLVPFSKVAPFHYNQFGYNIGGPFYIPGKFNKDKSRFFWYWGQEWVRYTFLDTVSLVVPTTTMRQGNFSELLAPNNVFYNKAVVINDPLTGQPFPGNIIPANRQSPAGMGILRTYPLPNLGTYVNGATNYYKTAIHPQNTRKDTLAVDMNITDRQRLQFRRNNYAYYEYNPLDSSGFAPRFFNRPNQTNSLDHVWTISPTVVNEFLATVSLDDVYIPVDTPNFTNRTTNGLVYPYIFPDGKLVPTRVPTVNFSSVWSAMNGGPYPSHSSGPIYDVSDSLTWVKGSHTMKFGFLFERQGENDNDEINVNACPTCTNNQNGQFSFTDGRSGNPTSGNSLANAALGLFDTYSELGQRAYTIFRGDMYEAFAQDSWKVKPNFTLNYGVRYTVIVPYHALWANMAVFDPKFYDTTKSCKVDPRSGAVIVANGCDRYNGLVIPGNGWPDSAKGRFPESTSGTYDYLFRGGAEPNHYSDIQWGQFQPRLGFAWQVMPKTVIRAGGGRFFTRLGVSDSIFLGGNPPFQPTANVSFGNVDNPGGTQANSLPLTVTSQSKTFKNPEAWNWNFTLERETFFNSVVSVGYVGRRGLHLQREANINQPTTAMVAANPGVNLDALRPYLGYNSIRQTDNVASSMYNALQATWNRRFSKGLSFGVTYTYSKSNDSGSAQRDIIPDTYDASNLWGPSNYDVRHIFISNFLYELPLFRSQQHWYGKVAGGWQLSGIFQAQTGTPCPVVTNNDFAGVGQDGNWDGNGCSAGQFWVLNGSVNYPKQMAHNNGGANDAFYWFQPTTSSGALFTQPAKGTFNLQQGVRNIIYNPGFNNWNLGLFKKFAINERMGFQFRAQAYDAFNHPNWGAVNLNPTSAQFGQVTGKTNDVRNLQLSLRFYF